MTIVNYNNNNNNNKNKKIQKKYNYNLTTSSAHHHNSIKTSTHTQLTATYLAITSMLSILGLNFSKSKQDKSNCMTTTQQYLIQKIVDPIKLRFSLRYIWVNHM